MDVTARALVAPGKGILAADESLPTIEKRFKNSILPSTRENQCAYRELLFTTPGIEGFISGLILFDETIRQGTKDAVPMPVALRKQGVIPGIKVDKGATDCASFPDERIPEGLNRGEIIECDRSRDFEEGSLPSEPGNVALAGRPRYILPPTAMHPRAVGVTAPKA